MKGWAYYNLRNCINSSIKNNKIKRILALVRSRTIILDPCD